MTHSGRLTGKVAVVTGAASGMGAATAALFIAEGAQVLLTDVNDVEGTALADDLGPNAEYLHHDVGDATSWSELVDHVESAHERLDILVNNAGLSRGGSIDSFALEDFDVLVRVNQRGVLLGMRAVTALLRRAGGGSIINIASTAGMQGVPGLLVYTGTKFAVRGMTQVAAAELAGDKIRVNVIHPGPIDTPMHQAYPSEWKNALLERVPLGRFGEPEDVAEMALFLASDASSFITGSDFVVDGGFTL